MGLLHPSEVLKAAPWSQNWGRRQGARPSADKRRRVKAGDAALHMRNLGLHIAEVCVWLPQKIAVLHQRVPRPRRRRDGQRIRERRQLSLCPAAVAGPGERGAATSEMS